MQETKAGQRIAHGDGRCVYLIMGGLLLVVVLSMFYISYQRRCTDHIRSLRARMMVLRTHITEFRQFTGRQARSLDEFRQFARDHRKRLWEEMYEEMYVDLTSVRHKEVPEYRELNDKGGYFYDPNTGESRLNLTRRVRDYLPYYSGVYSDQIPSHW
jgi:hypothetical protein